MTWGLASNEFKLPAKHS